MPAELTAEETVEIKAEIRSMLDHKLQELGQEGFMQAIVNELYDGGHRIHLLQERLRLGKGMDI